MHFLWLLSQNSGSDLQFCKLRNFICWKEQNKSISLSQMHIKQERQLFGFQFKLLCSPWSALFFVHDQSTFLLMIKVQWKSGCNLMAIGKQGVMAWGIYCKFKCSVASVYEILHISIFTMGIISRHRNWVGTMDQTFHILGWAAHS